MRDVIAHEYFGVKLERIWEVVKTDVPDLKKRIMKIKEALQEEKSRAGFGTLTRLCGLGAIALGQQRAAAMALSGPMADIEMMVAEFKRRRDYVSDQLSKIPHLELDMPKGAFYLFPYVKKYLGKRYNGKVLRDDVALCEFFLEDENVAMIPGSAFGAKNYLRLSYACAMKELEKAMPRLMRGFKKLETD